MRIGVVVLLVGAALFGIAPATAAAAPTGVGQPAVVSACGPVGAAYAQCMAEIVAPPVGASPVTGPTGLSPATIKSAYHFPTTSSLGVGQTIAIVGAFDAPTIEADLAVFDQTFSLPPCTTANGCFSKVNSAGAAAPPATDSGWAYETHIDVEWAHAVAPGAKIVLVEASTNAVVDLLAGTDYARRVATYVSGSWGSTEGSPETILDHHFTDVPGVSWFFASGDNQLPLWPAASPAVVAVGGTQLLFSHGVATGEVGWSGSGGGCSRYEKKASAAQAAWPQYSRVGCAGKRAVPDLALDASPVSGVSVYDTQPDQGTVGWTASGGTSVATPIAAARAAGTGVIVDQNRVYSAPTEVDPVTGAQTVMLFRDILTGNNGHPAGRGYDLVTGRGSWIG